MLRMWPKIKHITQCYVKKLFWSKSLPTISNPLACLFCDQIQCDPTTTQQHNKKHKCDTKAHKQQHYNAELNANNNKIMPKTIFMAISTRKL
jgi:hypothetical protein